MTKPGWVVWAAILLALAACTPWNPSPEPIDTACIGFKPILLGEQDLRLVIDESMSQDLVDQILAHNETGQRRCGW